MIALDEILAFANENNGVSCYEVSQDHNRAQGPLKGTIVSSIYFQSYSFPPLNF